MMMTYEEALQVLKDMRTISGLCRTEKEAIDIITDAFGEFAQLQEATQKTALEVISKLLESEKHGKITTSIGKSN